MEVDLGVDLGLPVHQGEGELERQILNGIVRFWPIARTATFFDRKSWGARPSGLPPPANAGP